MSDTQTAKPTAAGILYLAGGRVLLLKRSDAAAAHPGTWGFPAGRIEAGETAGQAALREMAEETGGKPEIAQKFVENGDFSLFLCRGETFAPVLNAESNGYVWARPDDLPAPLHPGVQEAVERAMAAAPAAAAQDEAAVDLNGYINIPDNPLSKAGVYPYKGRSLPGAPDPDRIYMVYRPAEELADQACINSFKLLPWIDNHPQSLLGPEDAGLMPAEKKGVQGVIGEDVYFKPEDGTLYGNLKVFSQSLADLIEAGKRELSCGYHCKYERSPGTFDGRHYDYIQREIRGNHLALVESGRMGPAVAVMDGCALDQLTFSLDAKETAMADENNTPDSGGTAASLSLEDAVKLIAQLTPAIAAIQEFIAASKGEAGEPAAPAGEDGPADPAPDDPPASAGDADPAPTAPGGEKEPEKKPEGAAGMDAAELKRSVMAELAARDRLYRQVSEHVGAFDHADMTAFEVAQYGVKKLGIKAAAGQEMAVLGGFLQGRPAPRKQPAATVAAHAADAAPGGDNFITRHLKGA